MNNQILICPGSGGGPIPIQSLPPGTAIPVQPFPVAPPPGMAVAGPIQQQQPPQFPPSSQPQQMPVPISVPSVQMPPGVVDVNSGGGGGGVRPAIVTVPSYVRPGFAYNAVAQQQDVAASQGIAAAGPMMSTQPNTGVSTLPQTITMPSGIT